MIDASYMVLPILFDEKLKHKKRKFIELIEKRFRNTTNNKWLFS